MAKKKAKRKSSKRKKKRSSTAGLPLYRAKPKRKKKMPENVKKYLACLKDGKGKRYCKKKYLKE